MKGMKPQKQLLQFVMLSLLSIVSVLVMANESYAALQCYSCHGQTNDIRPLDTAPGSASSVRDSATGAVKGSHSKHLAATTNAANCNVCHNTQMTVPGHRDGRIELAATLSYNKGAGNITFTNQTTVPVLGTCSVACHNATSTTVGVTTPNWGETATCSSCHAEVPGSSHTQHVTSTLFKKATCADCHAGTTQNVTAGAGHLDGNVDVVGYTVQNKAKGSAVSTCTTTYCHSSGQSANGLSATPVYATVTWGGTAACGSCHATTSMSTGRHANHIVMNDNCGNCHTGASSTSYSSTAHVDGNINVAAGLGYTAAGTPGNGYGTCSAASCHAPFTNVAPKVTKSWTAGGIDCSSCHESNQITGAHNKHYALAAIGAGNCNYCHTSSGALTHADGSVNFQPGLMAAPVAKHPSTTYAATCTTACHAVYGATGSSPNWGVTGAGCATCHLTAIPATGLHTKHLAATGGTCTQCHAVGYTATALGTGHADGTVQVVGQGYPANVTKHAAGSGYATCSTASCHDAYGTTGLSASWNTVTTSCASCHAAVPVTGSHSAHLTHTSVTCASCHTNPGATAHVNSNVSVNVGGYPATVTKHAAGSGYSNCSNVVCHNGPSGQFTAAAATWGADLVCNSCHGNPPANSNHTGVLVNTCNSCHSNVVAGASTFINVQLHLNGIVEGGKCDSCHGYPPVQSMAGFGTNANYSSAKLQNYSGGGGAHSVAGHLALTLKASNGGSFAGCVTCHPSGVTHNEGAGVFQTAKVQVTVDTQFKFDKNLPIVYNKVSGPKSTGTCSNVSCHFKLTPVWSAETYTQGH